MHLTPLEWALVFLVSIVVIIYGVSKMDSLYSKRERGIKKEKKKGIKKK